MPKGSRKLLRNATGDTLRTSKTHPCTKYQQEPPQKSTNNSSPKAPKSSVFSSLWRTVSHTFNAFLENSEHAIRSCLCSPNSSPSTPDTPHNELKTHLWNTKTRTVSHSDFNIFFASKVDPRTCKPGLHWNGKHTNKC